MRVLIGFDAVDDGTKHVVRLLTGGLRDDRWRLDSLETYDVDDEDVKLSNLLVIGGGSGMTPNEKGIVPVSPLMEEFLNKLERIGIKDKRCVSFGTLPHSLIPEDGSAAYIQDRLIDMGAKILIDGVSFDTQNEEVLSMANVKRCEEFAEEIKRAFVGDMTNRYGIMVPYRGRISNGSDKELRE